MSYYDIAKYECFIIEFTIFSMIFIGHMVTNISTLTTRAAWIDAVQILIVPAFGLSKFIEADIEDQTQKGSYV